MDKIYVAKNDLSHIKNAVYITWEAIGPDAIELVGDDNLEALELCLDADRLNTHNKDQMGVLLFNELIDEFGYVAVLEFLNKHIKLV